MSKILQSMLIFFCNSDNIRKIIIVSGFFIRDIVVPTLTTHLDDLVSDEVELVTTQSPPITQGLVDGCQDLNGQ